MGNMNIMENNLIYSTWTVSKYENNELEQNYIINACIYQFSSTLMSSKQVPLVGISRLTAILSH